MLAFLIQLYFFHGCAPLSIWESVLNTFVPHYVNLVKYGWYVSLNLALLVSQLINCERFEDVGDQNLYSLNGSLSFRIVDLLDLKFVYSNLGLYLEQLLEITFFDTLLVEEVNPNQGIDCHSDIQF